jgi:hypothetical protein
MSYYDTSYPPSLWQPVPVINPTGVIPGTPGTFTPINAVTPADLAALQGLGPLGETAAWTTGQYVVLGNATNAHWSGMAWTAGIVAEDEPEEPEEEAEDETEEPAAYTAVPVDAVPSTEETPNTE